MDTDPSTHPSAETLEAYGLGKLDDASAEAVSKHLRDCTDCRSLVTEMTVSKTRRFCSIAYMGDRRRRCRLFIIASHVFDGSGRGNVRCSGQRG